jgi:hypothetical protein
LLLIVLLQSAFYLVFLQRVPGTVRLACIAGNQFGLFPAEARFPLDAATDAEDWASSFWRSAKGAPVVYGQAVHVSPGQVQKKAPLVIAAVLAIISKSKGPSAVPDKTGAKSAAAARLEGGPPPPPPTPPPAHPGPPAAQLAALFVPGQYRAYHVLRLGHKHVSRSGFSANAT